VALTAVFDTNILFSATAWRGNPFQCVERARVGEIQAVTCPELMDELAQKLELKLGFSAEYVFETLADYLGFLRMVSIPKLLQAVPRDPDDNMGARMRHRRKGAVHRDRRQGSPCAENVPWH